MVSTKKIDRIVFSEFKKNSFTVYLMLFNFSLEIFTEFPEEFTRENWSRYLIKFGRRKQYTTFDWIHKTCLLFDLY